MSLGLRQEDAARVLDLVTGTYQNYERNIREPHAPAFVAFTKAGINANWLLTGEGEMLLSGHNSLMQGQGCIEIPYCVDNDGPSVLSLRADFIRTELRSLPANIRLLKVVGDSMDPTLRGGDHVLVNIGETKVLEGLYVVRINDALLVKRLQALPDGMVNIASDNHLVRAWSANLSQSGVAVIGKVVCAWRVV